MSVPAVRLAAEADLADVGRISEARPFTAKWTPSAIKSELERPDSLFVVVELNGMVHGYALARVVDDDCRLLDLASGEDGKGLGRALIGGLADAARSRGCAKISLEASASNTRALAFYVKAGAALVGRRPKFYYDGSDAVLMDLKLP